jgi:hypothetical protein
MTPGVKDVTSGPSHKIRYLGVFMKKILFTLTTLVPLLQAGHLLADTNNLPKFTWDNQEGLKSAAHCHISPMRHSKLAVSTYFGSGKSLTESLRNYNGIRQSHLLNGSLIKIIDAPEKRSYKKVEVIGLNRNQEVTKNRWFTERLDSGYLYKRSLAPIEDYVIEVGPQSALKLSESSNDKADYYKVHGKTEYEKIDCPENETSREYLLFHVYSKANSQGPVAQVGVYWDETSLFKNIVTHKKLNALSLIPTLLEDENLAADLAADRAFMENTFTEEERENYKQEQRSQESFGQSRRKSLERIMIQDEKDDVITQQGLEQVVCIGSQTLNVRHKDLSNVIFRALRGEKVKIFQSWGENKQTTIIGGVEYDFVKVEFPAREESDQKTGWVAANFIEGESDCKFIPQDQNETDHITDTQITGLDDEECCEFPTVKQATHPYTSGMRRFRAGRGGGTRLHAAADIYRYKDEPILSVAPGEVIRDKYYFYQGTYALELVHSSGFIVRYGEITGMGPDKIKKGSQVKMGQRIGYMGVVNSGCCRPMLHFELYEGSKRGSLSQRGNKFQRRSDLINPTPYLLRWEDEKF